MLTDVEIRGFIIATVALASLGCERGPVPEYVRLSGAAPTLPGAPGTRATLVVFWASWCAPCVSEAPSLVALAQNPVANLSVVVVGHEETRAGVNAFFKGEPPGALNMRLDDGAHFADAFGVTALPAAFLVVDGQRVARFSGSRDWDSSPMRKLLLKLVGSAE